MTAVAALINAEVAHSRAQEGEWVASTGSAVVVAVAAGATGIVAVGVARRTTSGGRVALVEGLFSARVEAALLRLHATVAAHLGVATVRTRLSADSRRKSVSGGRAVRLRAEVTRRAGHGAATVLTTFLVHSAVRLTTHRGAHRHVRRRAVVVVTREVGHATLSDDGSLTAGCTTAQAACVLSEVVVLAALVAALPVAGTERNRSTATATRSTANVATHATIASMAVVVAVTVTVTAVAAHHARVTIALLLLAVRVLGHAVALAVRVRLRGAHSRERAAEASSAALEVGETAAGASPVTGTRAVL